MVSHGHRTMRALSVALVTCALAATPASAQSYWFETYDKAVSMVEHGRPTEARELLAVVMKAQPAPIPDFRAPGNRFIDYVPFHYQARIQLALGDTRGASHSLDVSEAFGESRYSDHYARETTRLRRDIAARTQSDVSAGSLPQAAVVSAPPIEAMRRPD